jgi:[acyl-carrier-protein] S-malonyltransferase
MIEDQIEVFVEIGPGRVLTGLLKKIMPATASPAQLYNVYDLKTLEAFIQAEKRTA